MLLNLQDINHSRSGEFPSSPGSCGEEERKFSSTASLQNNQNSNCDDVIVVHTNPSGTTGAICGTSSSIVGATSEPPETIKEEIGANEVPTFCVSSLHNRFFNSQPLKGRNQ